ncbi:hypothetical protein CEXT_203481 [Caerostris extrusa]|uniref:Uncharacterized protein n=1 Tax=Caerostris extrusa TaxID=172846 RepID=A0AAV4P2T8_CAEEX|nr:hypothetical protein CEXT_203481 [Caerostris extrusa]
MRKNVFPRRKTPYEPPANVAAPISEYLYAHAEDIVKIIQLKSQTCCRLIRPAACKNNPNSLPNIMIQAFNGASQDEMFAL